MDIAEDPDINLSVPLKPIYEEFCCPICFMTIVDCYITPCGHNFCKECIQECLNRKHVCPCCNAETTNDKIHANLHFDRLIQILEDQKEKSSKAYFDNLILGNSGNHQNGDSSETTSHELSPIEQLFHKHMKRSLVDYEEYYNQLKLKFDQTIKNLKKEYKTSIKKNKKEGNQVLVKTLQQELEQKKLDLSTSFEESVKLLLEGYDKYMADFAPTQQFLPVTITVVLEQKNIRLEKVVLKSTDSAKDLKEFIVSQMEKRGDPISEFAENNTFIVSNQFENEHVIINDEDRPIIQYKVDQGCIITLKGEIKFQSDMPHECFTAYFEKGKGLVMDYYTCKTCKFNWICAVCAKTCHKDHEITEYISNHTPTWACCYCVKKNNDTESSNENTSFVNININ